MIQYQNGNAIVDISYDGTRVIEYDDVLQLDYPLNIDIRVSTQCSLGFNPKTGKSTCSFCHESATTTGNECDYEDLKNKLIGLPGGIELAIGANDITPGLVEFLVWAKYRKFICNLTVNQLHTNAKVAIISELIDKQLIKGLGISYRPNGKAVPQLILDYDNTVFHVIAGIDSFEEIYNLKETHGARKILVLGEKDFGFNEGNVDLTTQKHKEWLWFISKLFDKYEVVSFDNLALDQLRIKRFFNDDMWETFNQGEHSFYINAVGEYYSPSSRNPNKTNWDELSVTEYFKQLEK